MHEPAIAAELIRLAQDESARAGYPDGVITSVIVRIGALRGIVEDNLRLAFDVLKADTSLQRASLVVQKSPVRGTCRRCGAPFQPEVPLFICAACGSGDLEVTGGNELDLLSLTLETE